MEFWTFCKDWLFGFLGINLIMDALENGYEIPAQAYVQLVFSCVTLFFGVLTAYRAFYLLVGLFAKQRKYPEQKKENRYAFLLSARNEQAVIGNLIDSIRALDYPQGLIDIYLVADNCSEGDKTAEIAREKGCIVYERHDQEHARKGYALEFMMEEMKKRVDLEKDYYAYVLCDSDNVLAPDFLSKINDAFVAENYAAVSGYRNIKNLNENWITALNGINFYRNTLSVIRPRSVLHCHSQAYAGTGFALRSRILKDGWHWTEIVEDCQLSTLLASEEENLGFCEEAEFYDEQPSSLKISFRQRLRWAKGSLIVWWKYGPKLMASFFKRPSWQKYDLYWDYFPFTLFSFLWPFLYQVISLIMILCTGVNAWPSFFNYLISTVVGMYFGGFVTAAAVLIREWKRVHFKAWQAFLMLFLWPLYDLSGIFLNIACLFTKTVWKPIPHKVVADPKALVKEEQDKMKKKKLKDVNVDPMSRTH